MTTDNNENAFKNKAPALFNELREKVKQLKETEVISSQLLKFINEAESLLKNKPEESEKKYYETLCKLETIKISHESKPLALKLLLIEISYLVALLLLGYFTYKWPHFVLWDGLTDYPISMHLHTVWFGALGGITIAIYGIYEHTHLRDFDPKYDLWYICKPLVGGIFGWFVYLIYYLGLVSVQGTAAKPNTPELPYIISFLAGFSERFTLKMIDKLMSVLTSWEEKPSGSPPKEEEKKLNS